MMTVIVDGKILTKTVTVSHEGALDASRRLVEDSIYFSVQPLPFDNYAFTVKDEARPTAILRELLAVFPPNAEED